MPEQPTNPDRDERFLSALRELCDTHGVAMIGTFGGDTHAMFSDGRELNLDSTNWRSNREAVTPPAPACR